LAVRAALGATRWRIARQLLVEGLVLALAGGAAGVLLAVLTLRALRSVLPEMVLNTMPNVHEIGVDRLTLGYTLALSVFTSLLFGLLPALRAARGDFQGGLREAAAAGGSRGTRRLRATLVVGEVALSTVLLVGAGLLVRSHGGLQRVSPGFAPEGVVTMTLSLPDYAYPDPPRRLRFYEEAVSRIGRLPGVAAAGFVNVLPFSTYDRGTRLIVQGAPPTEPGGEPDVSFRVASPGYLDALRLAVLEGRGFDARDYASGAPVALVNRTLARRFLGGEGVGRNVRLGATPDAPWVTIVGVVGDVHHSSLTKAPDPEVYVPLGQSTPSMMMLAVRAGGHPGDVARAVREEILHIDPAQPVYHVKTMERLLADSLLPRSTSAAFMSLFGALALVLAAVGVYGVVAYSVSQQTREFGLRIALGATPRDLLSLVLRHGLVLVGAGVALGGLAALAASRLLGAALYGVGPADPRTYATVGALLAATGLIACLMPAWRAAKTQPATALRVE
ncbi:MAG TPA: FtsX-like permease family protein, partial [Vicinamibacteria bacterium]|nr:FtsX-like permease family protein [Vicinamibacteria bacterium]